ncbi:MAG: hypothetical protein KKB37_09360 [Alphaproteobacteria bacterium]|nr:hypothetical protein [Alphaproteobacteria bacterium]
MRETFSLIVATAIAITFTTTLTAAIAATPAQGKSVEGGCYHGAGWSGGPHWLKSKGGGVASYMSCSSGTSHFDFECQPGSPEITFSIGSLGEHGSVGSALNMLLSVGNKTFKFPGKVANNQAWNDQRPTVHLPRNHEVLNALISGTSGQVRVGRHSFKFYLKGARGPIEAMLAACPGPEPINRNARADTQANIGQSVATPNGAAKAGAASTRKFNGPCVRGYT